MLRENSKVNVVFDKGSFWEWKAGTYTVQRAYNGQLGIDYNRTHSPYCAAGYEVVPFSHFSSTVYFISSGDCVYRWDNIKNRLVCVEKLGL